MSNVAKTSPKTTKRSAPAKGMAQREAVFKAVVAALRAHAIHFEGTDVKKVLKPEIRAEVNLVLCKGFTTGKIALKPTKSNKAKLADESALRAYVSGLVSNWVAKDERLNGKAKKSA